MSHPSLKSLVAFSILMENDEGITGKSPDYVMEKFDQAVHADKPETLLDHNNTAKFRRWQERWNIP